MRGGARWQASVLAAIYVDFTSGLREITLVGPAIGQSGGGNDRTQEDRTGWGLLPAAFCHYRPVACALLPPALLLPCPPDLLELCVQEFLVIILPGSCKLTCII